MERFIMKNEVASINIENNKYEDTYLLGVTSALAETRNWTRDRAAVAVEKTRSSTRDRVLWLWRKHEARRGTIVLWLLPR